MVLSAAVQFALQSMLLVNSVNLQSALGFSAVHAGLTGLPLTLVMTALAPFAGRLTDPFGGKYVLMTGLAIYAAGIAGVVAVASATATSATFAPVLAVAGLGMGAIFAPLATMGMKAAPPSLAGAASGVLNTGRQLGATLGGAITGAVLATQLAADLRSGAVAAARALPAPARRPFVAGFTSAARAGLQVGSGQVRARVPAGTPAGLASELGRLTHDVFARAYIAAMHPALGVSVALLTGGALSCLLLRRSSAPAPAVQPPSSLDAAEPLAETAAEPVRAPGRAGGDH